MALFWNQFQAAHVDLLCLAGREPQPLSGKAQEEEESSGGTAAPALLGFTNSVTQRRFGAVALVVSTSLGQARENINPSQASSSQTPPVSALGLRSA